jgi:hypothetical protein
MAGQDRIEAGVVFVSRFWVTTSEDERAGMQGWV